ncbi:uncharacterized GPI-anchored protein At5g19250-like [Pistacia vera]|uniref:uncharacterized GPI-anchored protein At5g19250-like n=1 Tax=Pistacia vera TaxID=55513 RepID=UPI001263D558|nr:uncharacterized GPI-anchored protein At5g19250-like [Pistacia vera]
MAALKLSLFFLVLLQAICFLPHRVHCGDEEDILQGLNSYRTLIREPHLTENKNAKCVAEKIAEDLEDYKCNSTNGVNTPVSTQQQFATEKIIKKCKILPESTKEGVILSVCVHKLVPSLVFTNFTYTYKYTKFLKSSNYTGAGLGCSDDWMVLVLTTNTVGGNFTTSGAISFGLRKINGLSYNVVGLVVALLVYLVF